MFLLVFVLNAVVNCHVGGVKYEGVAASNPVDGYTTQRGTDYNALAKKKIEDAKRVEWDSLLDGFQTLTLVL